MATGGLSRVRANSPVAYFPERVLRAPFGLSLCFGTSLPSGVSIPTYMDADVEPRFGRSPCFILVDPEEGTFEALENPDTRRGGANVQATELIAAKGVKVLLTGQCGPKASDALAAAGIEVVTGCSGTVRDVVEQFQAGQLQPDDESQTPPESASDG